MLGSAMPQPHWTLVTGASGFVGARLVRRLVENGERVRAFVRPGSELSVFADLPRDRLELAFGDVTVEHTVFRALGSVSRVFHLAAEHAGPSLPRGAVSRTIV